MNLPENLPDHVHISVVSRGKDGPYHVEVWDENLEPIAPSTPVSRGQVAAEVARVRGLLASRGRNV